MKIISGTLKGRQIKDYQIEGTRPTMDRVKESIFGSIQNHIKDSIVLDLFAGTGNLGIEAISNGAQKCIFIDNNKKAVEVISKNITTFKIEKQSTVIKKDYKEALKQLKNKIKFDIIFLDPPYKYNIIEELISTIINYDLLNKNGLIVIECQQNTLSSINKELELKKEKKFGDKKIYILKKTN